jgi:PAS domain S-box-containing protein
MTKKREFLEDASRLTDSLKLENEALKEELRRIQSITSSKCSGKNGEPHNNNEYRDDRFETVFESSCLGNKIISSDLKILQVNPALVALLGYDSKDDIIGTCIMDYSPLDHQQHWEEHQEKLWNHTCPSFTLETTLIRKDGSIIWCQVTSTLFQDKGQTLGYTIIEDIINHHRLRQFEALIKSGNDIICIMDNDGMYKYVSPSVKRFLHFEPEYFIGRTAVDFIHPDDVVRTISAFKQVLYKDENVHISPFRFKNAAGNWCWLELFATNMMNDPAILGIVINSRDVSLRIKEEQEKRIEAEKLRQVNERYELVAKATKDVIWDWDLASNQLSREKGFKAIIRIDSESETPTSASWDDYIHPDDKEEVLKSIIAATMNPEEEFWQKEYRYIRTDNSIAFITDRGFIIRDAAKKAIKMVGAMQDNTELKEKELRIIEQNNRMREISQINSHVIRKPVASMLGLMDLIDKKSIVGEHNLEVFEHLLSSAQELDTVIKHINEKTLD